MFLFFLAIVSMVLLGLGTALVYPNFLTVVAENTHPHQRAQSLSIFRFWRDSGYVVGAILSGILADTLGLTQTMLIISLLTAVAGLLAQLRMCCTAKLLWKSKVCAEVYWWWRVTVITKMLCFHLQLAFMNAFFWDTRYKENEMVYGMAPNLFFKRFINTHKPGSLLLPAEGEGRNALYAAAKGWQVDAFDFSEVAKAKAVKEAQSRKLNINYWTQDIATFKAGEQYDAIGLIYVHLPENLRKAFHHEIYQSLRSGGYLVFESFAKEQINYESGGPRDLDLLYDAPSVCSDFPFLHLISCGQKEIQLDEGSFHRGKAAVLQMIGQKL